MSAMSRKQTFASNSQVRGWRGFFLPLREVSLSGHFGYRIARRGEVAKRIRNNCVVIIETINCHMLGSS
jgi:hypothetical protein